MGNDLGARWQAFWPDALLVEQIARTADNAARTLTTLESHLAHWPALLRLNTRATKALI